MITTPSSESVASYQNENAFLAEKAAHVCSVETLNKG
jgi:hypothetical protein